MQTAVLPESLPLSGYDRVLVAFSGGLDSTVLLHAAAALRQQRPIVVRAVHIHHGLSRYADEWLEHCQAVCRRLNVPLITERVTLNPAGRGIEASAREARYNVFSALLTPGEALVTAHHQDDQCETLLLALKRGSGPAGLAAMPVVLPFACGALVRPLLSFTRQQLYDYAAQHQLRWVDDDSNQDPSFDRNFLRLNILPALEQRWPHFTTAVARSAVLCGEQEALLDELLFGDLDALVTAENALPVQPLTSYSPLKRAALLRRWLARCGAPMPARSTLAQLWQEVALSREDANPRMVLGDGEIRRYEQYLWWVRVSQGQRSNRIPWKNRMQPLILPAGLGQLVAGTQGTRLRLPRVDELLSVRFTAPGRLYITGRDRGRSLKKIWQEARVPPWRRETTPILFYNEEPVCAPGVFVCRQAEPEAGQEDVWWLDWQQAAR